MPCYDGRELDGNRGFNAEMAADLDELTRITCEVMELLDGTPGMKRISQRSARWYARHLEKDRRRQRGERAAKRNQIVRKEEMIARLQAELKDLR